MNLNPVLLTFIISFLIALLLIELLLGVMLRRLRNGFQWLILASRDVCPPIEPGVIEKFVRQSYDPELGWVLKPGRVGKEVVKSAGEASDGVYPSSQYRINDWGCRSNPGHEQLPHIISTYGDSFVFSRQVDDNQTWQWQLSSLTQTHVSNWGVGNYGIDQALLRLKREYPRHPTSVVMLASVPETLVRILSTWKHYTEYGNTLAFKPRYRLDGGLARLCPNPIDHPDKFEAIPQMIQGLQDNDYWYANKFKKDLLSFPYFFSLCRNAKRHIPLIKALVLRGIAEKHEGLFQGYKNRPWELILERNAKLAYELDHRSEAIEVFEVSLDQFLEYAGQQGFRPVYVLFPYRDDIERIQSGQAYFENMRRVIAKKMPLVDIAQSIVERADLPDLYLNDFYGGHLSVSGNKVAGQIIFESLNELGLLPAADQSR